MIQVCALASGSNGNCYYVGNEHEAVLIDAGISRRQVMKRMREVGLSMAKIKAVFITHEHADHVVGLRVLCDLHNIVPYLTKATAVRLRHNNIPSNIHLFKAGDSITVGGITVHSFGKKHDAVDPCSFRVEVDGTNVAVLTDLGTACANVKEHLALCDAAFLESNYDERLLEEGPYPAHLKHRVKSDRGHLSNEQAVKLADKMRSTNLKTIILSHISADNNRPELALKAFQTVSDRYEIMASSRYAPSKVIHLKAAEASSDKNAVQLGLFE